MPTSYVYTGDEVMKVRTRTPQSIIIATISNAIMLFAFVLCLLFTMGNAEEVANTPTGVPLIEVFYQATNSKPATNFLVLMPVIIFIFATFNILASVSRLIWVFAKDKGIPFSNFFSRVSYRNKNYSTHSANNLDQVHPTFKLPLNALGLVCVTSFLLAIIYVVSTTAFNAIVSLQAFSLNVSYSPPILFITLKKIRRQEIEYGEFKLGRYGIPINLVALGYLFFVILWIPFPTELPVTGSNMNYAGPLLGALIIAALLDWTISGHKRFKIPVAQTL